MRKNIMFTRFQLMSRLHPLAVLTLSLGFISSGRLLAGSIPAWAQNTEIMMETEGAEMTFIGRYFGPDNTSPLSFTSNQDIADQSFSFSLNPGTTYLGQSMTLRATGDFNTTTDEWDVTTNGSLGSTTWSSSYTASITGDPTYLVTGKITVPLPGFPLLDMEIKGALFATFPPPLPLYLVASIGTAQATVLGLPVGPTFGVYDLLFKAEGWSWGTGGVFLAGLDANGGGHDFQIASSGLVTPVTGGSGTFISQVQSVPEPTTASLLFFGLIGMGVLGRRSRFRRTSRGSAAPRAGSRGA
jgi:hypothetical protein